MPKNLIRYFCNLRKTIKSGTILRMLSGLERYINHMSWSQEINGSLTGLENSTKLLVILLEVAVPEI
jgi:cytolysin (calcineurin-like family phosphatase)